MAVSYPTRCVVIDVNGQDVEVIPGLVAQSPSVSLPHVGKRGLAERMPDGNVRLTLDDGTILMGYECWWQPLAAPWKGDA